MGSGRPRRSAVPTSFRIEFPALSDQEEAGEEGADDQAGDGAAVSREASNHPAQDEAEELESASGSEYDPEKGKKPDEQQQDESEDSAEFEEDSPDTEPDDGDSAAGEADIEGISIADSENLLPHERELSPGAPGQGQGLKHGKKRAQMSANDALAAAQKSGGFGNAPVRGTPMQVVGRTPFSIIASTHAFGKKAAPRRRVPGFGTAKKVPAYDVSYGSVFSPTRRLILTADFDDVQNEPSRNDTSEEAEQGRGMQQTECVDAGVRLALLRKPAFLPFGPMWDSCEDFAWYKGKYRVVDVKKGELATERCRTWGGWYDSVPCRAEAFLVVENVNEILPYLPRNTYPSVPQPINLIFDDSKEKAEKSEFDHEFSWPGLPDGAAALPPLPPLPVAEHNRSAVAQTHILTSNAAPMLTASNPLATQPARTESLSVDDSVVRLKMGLTGPITVGDNASVVRHEQQWVTLNRFEAIRLDSIIPRKPGFMFNAGGPVFGLDWCPQADDAVPAACEYLAVSTVCDTPMLAYKRQLGGFKPKGAIQLWSMSTTVCTDLASDTDMFRKGKGCNLEMVTLLDYEAREVRWCPKGGTIGSTGSQDDPMTGEFSLKRLGILATLSIDGSLRLYDVPIPSSLRMSKNLPDNDLVFYKPKAPLLTLEVGHEPISCFEWANHDRIVVGCSTGNAAIFHVAKALDDAHRTVEPDTVIPLHETAITMISVARDPHTKPDGYEDLDSDPPRFVTAALDGSTKMIDLTDWGTIVDFGHERAVRVTTRYSVPLGGFLFQDQDLAVRFVSLKMREFGASTRIVSANGPAKDLASSNNHYFAACALADGTCGIFNVLRRMKRSGHATHYLTKLYRLDFNRKTGEYRMLDNIVPDSRANHEFSAGLRRKRAAKTKKKKKKQAENNGEEGAEEEPEVDEDDDELFPDADTLPSIGWPPEVSVNKVAWHPSLRRCHILASGMACGLVRVDMTARPFSMEAGPSVRQDEGEGDDD